MPIAIEFFVGHAYAILFLWVLVEQFGLPVPSIPLLLTAGTLSATHRIHFTSALLAVSWTSPRSPTLRFSSSASPGVRCTPPAFRLTITRIRRMRAEVTGASLSVCAAMGGNVRPTAGRCNADGQALRCRHAPALGAGDSGVTGSGRFLFRRPA